LTIEEMQTAALEEEAKALAGMVAFESNGRQYTADEARALFNKVCNTKHWKLPWSAAVHHSLVDPIMKAVEYFHADVPEVLGIQPLTGLVVLEGHGYQAW